jgi:carboxymethylenebutenolidase
MGDRIEFDTPAGPASGYRAAPEGEPRAGLVVIQEWWGLVPHICDVADRFAAEGYLVLAPDIYHGRSTVDAEEAHHLMDGLDWGRAAAEIGGAVASLRTAGATKVGVVGYCMGGALAVIAALGGVDAYNAYYGFPPTGAAPVDSITAPGLIFFGEHEDSFSVPDAEAFAVRQRATGRDAEVIVFPGAGHAFFNDTRAEAYVADAAEAAWERTLAFFARNLAP